MSTLYWHLIYEAFISVQLTMNNKLFIFCVCKNSSRPTIMNLKNVEDCLKSRYSLQYLMNTLYISYMAAPWSPMMTKRTMARVGHPSPAIPHCRPLPHAILPPIHYCLPPSSLLVLFLSLPLASGSALHCKVSKVSNQFKTSIIGKMKNFDNNV